MDEVEKSEFGQKGKKLASDLSAGVGRTAETISKQTEHLSQTGVYQSVAYVSISIWLTAYHVPLSNIQLSLF